MKYRELPLIQELRKMSDKDHAEAVAQIASSWIGSPMAQVLGSILQAVEAGLLEGITHGVDVEKKVGGLQALREIRKALVSLLPVQEQPLAEAQLELVAEEPYMLYDDAGFSVPYPKSQTGA
jgi:hypothetical protein